MPKITLSYRRDDSMDITGRIFDRLANRYGREAVFRDIDSIPPGRDFRDHIATNLGDSDVLIVVVGPHWMGGDRHGKPRIQSDTDYVRTEVEIALSRKIPVIPLLVGDADMPEPGDLPESIRDYAYRNAVAVDSGRDFDHHMNGLIRHTDQLLQGAAPQPNPPSPAVGSASGVVTAPSDILRLFVGGIVLMLGLMHAAWFGSNVFAAASSSLLDRIVLDVWNSVDAAIGFGGIAVGLGTFFGQAWSRYAGMTLCLLGAACNLMWLIESFDKELPRLVLVGTALALPLFVFGFWFYLLRWPAAAGK
jgi:hypothetical protein